MIIVIGAVLLPLSLLLFLQGRLLLLLLFLLTLAAAAASATAVSVQTCCPLFDMIHRVHNSVARALQVLM